MTDFPSPTFKNTTITTTLSAHDVIASGASVVAGNLNVGGATTLSGNSAVAGNLSVVGATTLSGDLTGPQAEFSGDLKSATHENTALITTGSINVTGIASIPTLSGPVSAPSLTISGLTATGTLTVGGSNITPGGVFTVSAGNNGVINGAFMVNQRKYVSNTALAAGAYGHDRWKAGAGGCTYTYVTTAHDTVINITAGTLTQVIELGWLANSAYTLSWTGTSQARVYQGSPTGAYASSPLTTSVIGPTANVTIEFNTGNSVGDIMFQAGPSASAFPRENLGRVLRDCQYYFRKLGGSVAFDIDVAGYCSAAGTYIAHGFTFSPMRAVPTLAQVGTFSVSNLSGGGPTFLVGADVFTVQLNAAAAGIVQWCNDLGGASTQYVTLNAEL